MKILFIMTNPRIMKFYFETLRFMLKRGRTIHVAYFSLDKHFRGTLHDELSKEYPDRFTFEIIPGKPPGSWRDLSIALAWARDYLFFLQPHFQLAHRLKKRVELRVYPAFIWLMNRCPGFRSHPGRAAVTDVLKSVDRAVPPAWTFKRYIKRINPDVLLVSPLLSHSGMQWEYLRAAKALGVPTGCCVASWDNLTTKGALLGEPDKVMVWNANQKHEAVELHDIPEEHVAITGAQHFDDWFIRRPSRSREDFCKEVGLSPEYPILLYMCSSNFMAPRERAFVAKWVSAIRESGIPEIANAGILIRPYPGYADPWQAEEFNTANQLKVWPEKGEYVISEAAKCNFFDSTYHSLAVVGVNTTAMIESAIIGKCVLGVKADEFSESQDSTIHFNYLRQENGGPLFLAKDMIEHLSHIESVLTRGEDLRLQNLRFVECFARPGGLEKTCIPELAGAIESLAEKEIDKPSIPVAARVLRLCLYPIAICVRAFGLARYFTKKASKKSRKAALKNAAQQVADPLNFLENR